jgi:hypothetical protein
MKCSHKLTALALGMLSATLAFAQASPPCSKGANDPAPVKPDVYEAGDRVLKQMKQANQVKGIVQYATNDLEIMIPATNPKNNAGDPDTALRLCGNCGSVPRR